MAITKEKITTFLTEMLAKENQVNASRLTPETLLKDLEIDSFGFLEVIFSIEHEYNVSFPKNYEHLRTVQDVIDETYNLVANSSQAA